MLIDHLIIQAKTRRNEVSAPKRSLPAMVSVKILITTTHTRGEAASTDEKAANIFWMILMIT